MQLESRKISNRGGTKLTSIAMEKGLSELAQFGWEFAKKNLTHKDFIETLKQTGVLFLLIGIDLILKLPPSGRLLYVYPIFRTTQRAGLLSGALVAGLATLFGTLLDSYAGLGSGWIVNAFVRAFGFGSLIFLVDSVQDRLKQTTTMAQCDPLTGALNRSGFTMAANQTLEAGIAEQEEVIVGMIDLDKFKILNDQYGHAFGDEVLKALVASVRPAVASVGSLGRIGGDEFQIVVKGISKKEAALKLQRATARFNDSTLVMGHKASFSFGLASTVEDGITMKQLLERADADMYQRKASKSESSYNLSA